MIMRKGKSNATKIAICIVRFNKCFNLIEMKRFHIKIHFTYKSALINHFKNYTVNYREPCVCVCVCMRVCVCV